VQDPQRVERMLRDLGSGLAEIADLSFYEDQISGAPVWLLGDDDFDEGQIGFGIKANTVFIGTPYDALRSALLAHQNPLSGSSRFQTATNPLPERYREYLYLDVEHLVRIIDRQGPNGFADDEVWRYISSIDTVSMAMSPLDVGDRLHGVVFVVMQE
jgi:hypothetical protein